MLQRLIVWTGIVSVLTLGHAFAAPKGEVCLDYWNVGMSGCDGKKPEEPEAAPPVPAAPSQIVQTTEQPVKTPTTLEERVQDFLDNYEKPPKEFVAFNLEPTLENALKWVQKYNEMIERNKQLTAAWSQAQQIYKTLQEQNRTDEIPALDNPSMPVPDYGVELPKEQNEQLNALTNLMKQAGDPFMNKSQQNTAAMFSDTQQQSLLGGTLPKNPFAAGGISEQVDSAADEGNIAHTSAGSVGGGGPVRVSYYFSAECPYCKKFEPGFQKVIEEMGSAIDVTCVDMTPSNRDISNIHGKIDCSWRPLMSGEMEAYGVKSTPTLLVSRAPGQPVERLSGYVDYNRLRDYLINGTKSK